VVAAAVELDIEVFGCGLGHLGVEFAHVLDGWADWAAEQVGAGYAALLILTAFIKLLVEYD